MNVEVSEINWSQFSYNLSLFWLYFYNVLLDILRLNLWNNLIAVKRLILDHFGQLLGARGKEDGDME